MTESSSFSLLKDFLENRPVCHRAASPLKPDASVRVIVRENGGQVIGTFRRDPERGPLLERTTPADPDFTLVVPRGMAEYLHALRSDDIGEFGIEILSRGLSDDPDFRMGVSIHVGFGRLFRHGYFGILRLGGWRLARAMAVRGLSGLTTIREKINRHRAPVS